MLIIILVNDIQLYILKAKLATPIHQTQDGCLVFTIDYFALTRI